MPLLWELSCNSIVGNFVQTADREVDQQVKLSITPVQAALAPLFASVVAVPVVSLRGWMTVDPQQSNSFKLAKDLSNLRTGFCAPSSARMSVPASTVKKLGWR
jgi:hypothetical protein